jgi:hypothetical protein
MAILTRPWLSKTCDRKLKVQVFLDGGVLKFHHPLLMTELEYRYSNSVDDRFSYRICGTSDSSGNSSVNAISLERGDSRR